MSGMTLADFKKCELRTAKILSVEPIEGADRIWRLEVELGLEKKQIVMDQYSCWHIVRCTADQ